MRCGAHDPRPRVFADTLNFKGLTIDVDGLAETVCGNCGYTWTTPGQEQDNLERMRAIYVGKRDEVRQRDGLLTGDEIAQVLEALGLTKARAASLFGGGPNAFAKYINGDVLQSVAMDRLIRLTMAFGERAVRYLELGGDAPLGLNAAGVFIAPMPVFSGWAEAEAVPAKTVESVGTVEAPVLVTPE